MLKYGLLTLTLFMCSLRSAQAQLNIDPSRLDSTKQYGPNDTIFTQVINYGGELIPYKQLSNVDIVLRLNRAQRERYRQWTRLRNAVYVTYPYAIKAAAVFNDINKRLEGVTDKRKRKEIIKSREKELRKEFAEPLTELSVYQGKILMKLIARETGNTCYEIIKEYKGGFNARFYQTVAWVFGSNLKQTYNAEGDDKQIELIVLEVRRMWYGS